MFTLNTLLDLPTSAVYAVLDEKHKRVLIACSTSLGASLLRVCDRIRSKESYGRILSEGDVLELVVLESAECRNRLHVRVGYWMKVYRERGYTLLVEKPPALYRLKCIPSYKANVHGNLGRFTLEAYLVSKRNSKILVGKFMTQDEYDAFQGLYYPNIEVYDIVYDVSVLK